ncbi:MAG: hypothetical protein KatS3mg065_0883 [Chloroflexota bacterium]|nr:MAG: hypothetical protein KatS3mg065_0883 [Chloroflexota bacterium]
MATEGELGGTGGRQGSWPAEPGALGVGGERGILDTSVLIDIEHLDPERLPTETFITAISLAELAAGPQATEDEAERARRQERLLWAATTWEPLPFDGQAARSYGTVFAAVRAAGRRARPRLADLFIAAIALSRGLPLYTRNPDDFRGLEALVPIVVV